LFGGPTSMTRDSRALASKLCVPAFRRVCRYRNRSLLESGGAVFGQQMLSAKLTIYTKLSSRALWSLACISRKTPYRPNVLP